MCFLFLSPVTHDGQDFVFVWHIIHELTAISISGLLGPNSIHIVIAIVIFVLKEQFISFSCAWFMMDVPGTLYPSQLSLFTMQDPYNLHIQLHCLGVEHFKLSSTVALVAEF